MIVRFCAVLAVVLLSVVSSPLHAAIILQIENTGLQANTPNQLVRILGTYDGTLPAVDGILLNVLIGLGGPDASLGPLPGNVDGPNITSINLKPAAGALSAFTSSQVLNLQTDQLIQVELLRADANAPISAPFTNQLVAELLVDTTGVAAGAYQVDLANGSLGISSNFLGGVGGAIATTLNSGTLNVAAVPEPGSLLLLSIVGIAVVAHRWRAIRRAVFEYGSRQL